MRLTNTLPFAVHCRMSEWTKHRTTPAIQSADGQLGMSAMTDVQDFDGVEPYLTGHMLIAMPGMQDPRFDKSLIYMCAHSPEGVARLTVQGSYSNRGPESLC